MQKLCYYAEPKIRRRRRRKTLCILPGSRLKWMSAAFEDGAELPFLRQYSKRGITVGWR